MSSRENIGLIEVASSIVTFLGGTAMLDIVGKFSEGLPQDTLQHLTYGGLVAVPIGVALGIDGLRRVRPGRANSEEAAENSTQIQ